MQIQVNNNLSEATFVSGLTCIGQTQGIMDNAYLFSLR